MIRYQVPFVYKAVLFTTLLFGATQAWAQDSEVSEAQGGSPACVFETLDNPFGNPTRAVIEFNGLPYTGGFFNFRRRDQDGIWADFGGGIIGPGANTTVDTILRWSDGFVYGGNFFSSGGVATSNIGFWDDVAFQALGPGLNGEVRSLVVYNGDLIAGGSFDATGDFSVSVPRVARWDGAAWQQLGDGLDFSLPGFTPLVWDLAVYNGDLWATGLFDASGATPMTGIARWDGTQWNAVGTGLRFEGDFGVGQALEVHDGKLYLSGFFDEVNGTSANFMAVYDGTSWSQVGTAATAQSLTLRSFGGLLYAGGLLSSFTINGETFGMASWDGQQWVGVGSADGNILDLEVSPTNADQLYIGGGFFNFNGEEIFTALTMTCDGVSTIFDDGFETGDTSGWSLTVP